MSKDLNKEYLEMIEADLPDLWDRIEAALPERKTVELMQKAGEETGKMVGIAAADGAETGKVVEIAAAEEKTGKTVEISESARKSENQTLKPKKTKIYRFSILAAACVCAAIVIPLAAINGRGRGSAAPAEQYATAAATDMAAAEAAPKAAPEEMKEAAMETEEAAEEGILFSNAAGGGDTDSDEMNDKGMISYAASGAASAAAGEETEESAADIPMSEESVAQSSKSLAASEAEATEVPYEMDQASPDEVLLDDVQIRITEKADYIGPEVFLAEVLNNTGYLTRGDIIFITADENSPEEYSSGIKTGTFTCTLQESETDAGDTIYIIR